MADEFSQSEASKVVSLVRNGRRALAQSQYGRATALWLEAIQLAPSLQEELEEEFCVSMRLYCEQLCKRGQSAQVQWLSKEVASALNLTPVIYFMLGSINFMLHQPTDAISCFSAAIEGQPTMWAAQEALENLKAMACDRWHYRMLNDSDRNSAYAAALEGTAGCRVLDIGTGTGILAIMAARAGATVLACDISPIMCSLAEICIAKNECPGICVTNVNSSVIAQSGEKFDIIVSELVDSGLLGEKIIPTLREARACLADGGIIIPRRAHVFAVLIDSVYIRSRSRLLLDSSGCLHGVHMGAVRIDLEEPYTCEPLYAITHTQLSVPQQVHTVDLQGLEITEVDVVRLSIVNAGELDCIAVWFDMELDAKNMISTNPSRNVCCGWDQGIYFLPAECRGHVAAGDIVTLTASHMDDRLVFKTECESWDQNHLTEMCSQRSISVGELDMARLNDSMLHERYRAALLLATASGGGITILDIADGWSLRQLIFTQLSTVSSVTCVQPTSCAAEALTLVHADGHNNAHASLNLISSLEILLEKSPQQPQFNILVADVCDGSGLFVANVFAEIITARSFLLTSQAIIIPQCITVMAVLIESTWLLNQNHVFAENCSGVCVEPINAFGARRYRELDAAVFPHRCLTDTFPLCKMNLSTIELTSGGCVQLDYEAAGVLIKEQGRIDAVLMWYDLTLFGDITLCTGPMQGAHWRQCATLVNEPVSVQSGVTVSLATNCSSVHGLYVAVNHSASTLSKAQG